MRPRVIRIGDGADVEEHRAWNMPAEIIVRWQRQHPRHLVGCVDDFDLWVVETGGEPIGGNKRIVGGCRHGCIISFSSFRDALLSAGPESILPVVVMDSGLARFARALRCANWRIGE